MFYFSHLPRKGRIVRTKNVFFHRVAPGMSVGFGSKAKKVFQNARCLCILDMKIIVTLVVPALCVLRDVRKYCLTVQFDRSIGPLNVVGVFRVFDGQSQF